MKNQIVEKIKEAKKLAIFHHNNIDGDSWSCSYGLLLALKLRFPEKEIVWVADEEDLKHNFPWLSYDSSVVVTEIDASYTAIIGDTASQVKLTQYDQLIKAKEILCFDHHRNPIDIKHNIFWSEPTYPASSIQAFEIAEALGVEFNEEIAFNMLLGILTDTGNFAYSLANTKPVETFVKLLKYVSNEKMDFFWTSLRRRTMRDIEVEKFFLENLKFDGKVAYVYFNLKDASQFSDVNFKVKIHSIGNIEKFPIWAIFVEAEQDNKTYLKLHFRSNGPEVSKVAIAHGGGGHIRAAGAKVVLEDKTLETVLRELNELK